MAKPRGKSGKPKRRKKLSQTPEAKRSRARRAEQARVAAIAERKRLAKNKRRRERYRLEKESIALSEAERREPGERNDAIGWLEQLTPEGAQLTITEPEIGARTPWLVVGRIDLPAPVPYAEAYRILDGWERDFILEATINPDRLAQIRVVYHDPALTRKNALWISNSGPWAALVSDLANEIDPANPDSLANRYAETVVSTIYVYFSAAMAQVSEIEFG